MHEQFPIEEQRVGKLIREKMPVPITRFSLALWFCLVLSSVESFINKCGVMPILFVATIYMYWLLLRTTIDPLQDERFSHRSFLFHYNEYEN